MTSIEASPAGLRRRATACVVIQISLSLQPSAAELLSSASAGSSLNSPSASTFNYYCGGSGVICLFSIDESGSTFVVSTINISASSDKRIYDFDITLAGSSEHSQFKVGRLYLSRPASRLRMTNYALP